MTAGGDLARSARARVVGFAARLRPPDGSRGELARISCPENVNVNVVAPGYIRTTRLTDRVPAEILLTAAGPAPRVRRV